MTLNVRVPYIQSVKLFRDNFVMIPDISGLMHLTCTGHGLKKMSILCFNVVNNFYQQCVNYCTSYKPCSTLLRSSELWPLLQLVSIHSHSNVCFACNIMFKIYDHTCSTLTINISLYIFEVALANHFDGDHYLTLRRIIRKGPRTSLLVLYSDCIVTSNPNEQYCIS